MKKYFATFKYLFFPFLMANCTGTDFANIFHTQATITVCSQTAAFCNFGNSAGLWKMNAEIEKLQTSAEHTFFVSGGQIASNYTGYENNQCVAVRKELCIIGKSADELGNY